MADLFKWFDDSGVVNIADETSAIGTWKDGAACNVGSDGSSKLGIFKVWIRNDTQGGYVMLRPNGTSYSVGHDDASVKIGSYDNDADLPTIELEILTVCPIGTDNKIEYRSSAVDFTIDQVGYVANLQPEETSTLAKVPIGTILMYNGTGIYNVAGRTLKLGDEQNDTISDIPYGNWYVCNGNSGAPNMLNKFVRGEATSGIVGGSDNAVVVSHKHAEGTRHRTNVDNAYGAASSDGNTPCTNGWSNTSRRHWTQTVGESGTGKNKPAYYSVIYIIRLS